MEAEKGRHILAFEGTTWKLYTSARWLALNHMASFSCKGGWEMESEVWMTICPATNWKSITNGPYRA